MPNPTCQQDDYGFAITVQFLDQNGEPISIANATLPKIIVGYPNGQRVEYDATLYEGGINGQIYYLFQDGDLPQFGTHQVQGSISLDSGAVVSTQVGYLDVRENIPAVEVGPIPDPHIGTFDNLDLVDGIFTIHHFKGLSAPFTISVTIFDSAGNQIVADAVTGATDSVAIDLSSFIPLSGVWGYVYI